MSILFWCQPFGVVPKTGPDIPVLIRGGAYRTDIITLPTRGHDMLWSAAEPTDNPNIPAPGVEHAVPIPLGHDHATFCADPPRNETHATCHHTPNHHLLKFLTHETLLTRLRLCVNVNYGQAHLP